MNKTFLYRIYTNQSTLSKIEEWISFCRHLYNLALEQRIYAYKTQCKSISKFEQMRQVTQMRQVFPEYKEINANVLHNVIKRLDNSYRGFFRRIKSGEKAGFPRFKGINRYNSITFRNNDGWKLQGKYLFITKVGKFKIKLSRPIEGVIKEIAISKKPSGKWFVSFYCKNIPNEPLLPTNKTIGIDMGCENFLTDSNGNKIDNPRFLNHSEKKLKKHQQSLVRKVKGSNRRSKAKILLAKTHEKVFNQRKDFHYKIVNKLLRENDIIYIEKLQSWNTWRILNRSMRDVAWFKFFSILKVKAEEAGRKIIEVPAKNTSQICSACGQIVLKQLKDRIHKCSCGLIINRDYNSALNILRVGQTLQSVSS